MKRKKLVTSQKTTPHGCFLAFIPPPRHFVVTLTQTRGQKT